MDYKLQYAALYSLKKVSASVHVSMFVNCQIFELFQLNSTQFIGIWQLQSWIEQTQRTHNKTQSIETQEHKNTKKRNMTRISNRILQ